MARKFYTLDVFTNRALAGNPLAVVMDSDGLDEVRMQDIASEFNLSETVFVFPPERTDGRARIKIYTPVHELPFAGHPTVGTALLLAELDGLGDGDSLILEEVVGPVSCKIMGDGDRRQARFELPKKSSLFEWQGDVAGVAQAIGLQTSDVGFDDHVLGIWDGGVPYMLVPLSSINAVENIKVDPAALKEIEPVINGIHANVYAYCRGGVAEETNFHARMFAPFQGIPEDPATGSAVASLSGQIAKCEIGDNESGTFLIEQGYEMGRPSQIALDITKADGEITSVGISGSAVIVSEGMLHL